jgi:hypothetical protein
VFTLLCSSVFDEQNETHSDVVFVVVVVGKLRTILKMDEKLYIFSLFVRGISP